MKLVIGGSTGFLATELIRQALSNPAFTSIIGLSRRETSVPAGFVDEEGKLKSVVVDDFSSYSETTERELEDADACIWTIAVTPSKLKATPWEEVVKICREYALTGLKTLASVPRRPGQPLRFIYISGHFAPRDSTTPMPKQLTDYGLVELGSLRGHLETEILEYAEQSNGAVVGCIAKPGKITVPGMAVRAVPGLPSIELRHMAAALLDQIVNGFEKDTLSNDDMIRIGQKVQP